MSALRDRTFNKGAWARLSFVALGLVGILGLIYISVGLHEYYVEVPRLLERRYVDPLGHPGRTTTQIARLGGRAVDTLIADLAPGNDPLHRSKSLEILSAIKDPRVVPALVKALSDDEIGLRLAALAGFARTQRGDLAKHLWPLTTAKSTFFRHRAMVALGLISATGDVPRLLEAANARTGRERLLFAWAAGYALRRAKLTDRGSDRVRPMKLTDAVHERAVQQEVNELRKKFANGGVTRERAERLSELVTVDFGTWNLNHQIGYQAIMVAGPLAIRGVARLDAPAPKESLKGRKSGKKADIDLFNQGLQLDKRPALPSRVGG